MNLNLTTGAIEKMMTGQDVPSPVLQIVGQRKIPTNPTDRYRLVLSDGVHFQSSAMLATQLNHLIESGELDTFAVVRLNQYLCNTIENSAPSALNPDPRRRVVILIQVTILTPGHVVGYKIGSPTAYKYLNVKSVKTGTDEADDSGVTDIVMSDHPKEMLSSMEELWEMGDFCDITVRIRDQDFQAHRYMLAAFSSFFRGMFASGMKESKQDVITLTDVEPDTFKILLRCCYTGKFEICNENVCQLLAAANFFNLPSILKPCKEHISKALNKLDMHTCVAILQLPEAGQLKDKAFDVAVRNFHLLSKDPSFMLLTDINLFIEILSSDKLNVSNETEVWLAVKKWYESDTENRKDDFGRLIEYVRFPLLSSSYLCTEVEEAQKEIQLPRLQELIEEAKYCHLCPKYRQGLEGKTSRIARRKNLADVEMYGGMAKVRLSKVSELSHEPVTCPMFEIINTRWEMTIRMITKPGATDTKRNDNLVEFRLKYVTLTNGEEAPTTSKRKVKVRICTAKQYQDNNYSATGNNIGTSSETITDVAVMRMYYKCLVGPESTYSKDTDSLSIHVHVMLNDA